MSDIGKKKAISLAEQLLAGAPEEALTFRLISTTGQVVVPARNEEPLLLRPFTPPIGLPDNDYYAEYYGRNHQIIANDSAEPIVVSYWRRPRPSPAAVVPPAAGPVDGAPTLPAALVSGAPTPAAPATPRGPTLPQLYDANPERWAQVASIRQDEQMRDFAVTVFEQGIAQVSQLHEAHKDLGQEQLGNLKKIRDQAHAMFLEEWEFRKKLLKEMDEWTAQRLARVKAVPEEKPKPPDMTPVILAALSTLQAIGVAIVDGVTSGKKKAGKPEGPSKQELAHTVVGKLAAVLADPEHREAFLSDPDVAKTLA